MKLNYSWVIFILSLIILVPTNMYRVLASLTSKSPQGRVLEIILTILFVICPIVIFILVRISKDLKSAKVSQKNSDLFRVISIAAGVGIFFQTIQYFAELKNANSAAGGAFVALIGSSTTIVAIICGMSVSFILAAPAVCYFLNKDFSIKLPYLILPIWCLCRSMVLWRHYGAMPCAAINMLDLISVAFFTLFFCYHAALLAKVVAPSSWTKRLFFWGLASSLFSFVFFTANIAKSIADGKFNFGTFSNIADLILAAYVVVSLLNVKIEVTASLESENYA